MSPIDDRNVLAVREVTKTFDHPAGEIRAVANVSFDIVSGEAVALMGPSGAGKSTIMHVVAGLEPMSTGAVMVAGHDLVELAPRQLVELRRSHIGFVFQFSSLLETLTVEDNIAIPGLMRRDRRSTRGQRVAELLETVMLSHRRTHYPTELSAGEQLRVALARALYANPSLLLADEPTGNLDSHAGNELVRLIISAQRERNGGLLLATHDSHVASMCDRVIYIRDGYVRAQLSLETHLTSHGNQTERDSLVHSWLQELDS